MPVTSSDSPSAMMMNNAAAFGEVRAFDVPILDRRTPEARHPEIRNRRERFDGERERPPRQARVVRGRCAGDPARGKHEGPHEQALEVAPPVQGFGAHGPQEEQRATDLQRGVRRREQHAARIEGLRDRDRDADPREHQRQQRQPDRDAFGIEPVGHPRGVDPHPPHAEQQHADLHQPAQREVGHQRVRELGDREDEDEVEKQLDHPHLAAVGGIARAQQGWTALAHAAGSRAGGVRIMPERPWRPRSRRARDNPDRTGHAHDLRRPRPRRLVARASARVRADGRRMQHRVGHPRLSRSQRRLEAQAARHLPGLPARTRHARPLLGAQPRGLADGRACAAERGASCACGARTRRPRRTARDAERRRLASTRGQPRCHRSARAHRCGALSCVRRVVVARRRAGTTGHAQSRMDACGRCGHRARWRRRSGCDRHDARSSRRIATRAKAC